MEEVVLVLNGRAVGLQRITGDHAGVGINLTQIAGRAMDRVVDARGLEGRAHGAGLELVLILVHVGGEVELRVDAAVGVQLVIPVHQIHEAFLRGDDLVGHGLGQNAEALADVLIQKSAALVAQVGDVQTPRVVHAVSVGVFLGDAHGVLIQIVGRYRNVHAKLLEPVAAIRNGQRRQLLHARQAVQLVAQRAHAAVLEIGLVEPREGVGQLVLQLLQILQ